MLSEQDGKFLLFIARESIRSYLMDRRVMGVPENTPKVLKQNMGVFVTIHRDKELRGCIGYPEPIKPLVSAVIEVAISAATRDPRFDPIRIEELDKVEIEVSVLTKPQLIKVEKPENYIGRIKIGEDGLIVENGFYKGLLLPQVAVEWGWGPEEFLCNTCMKAGLSPDCWCEEATMIYSFQSLIFQE
jgi:uncharacterized protein